MDGGTHSHGATRRSPTDYHSEPRIVRSPRRFPCTDALGQIMCHNRTQKANWMPNPTINEMIPAAGAILVQTCHLPFDEAGSQPHKDCSGCGTQAQHVCICTTVWTLWHSRSKGV